jgi:hypothetical protein
MLPAAHKSPKWSIFFQISCTNICMYFSFSHVCYMTYPYQFPWSDHSPAQYAKPSQCVQPCIKHSTDGLWKLTEACHKILCFFGHENWQMTTIKNFCVHRSTKHLPCFLTQLERNIFLQLSAALFLALSGGREHRIFHNLEILFCHTRHFVGSKQIHLEESWWYITLFLISVPVCNPEKLPKPVMKHTNERVQTHIGVGFQVSTAGTMKLTVLWGAVQSERLLLNLREVQPAVLTFISLLFFSSQHNNYLIHIYCV